MKKRFETSSLSKLTALQTIATVFVFSWSLCPTVFALERGQQAGKQMAREVVSRFVGVEQADSLLEQVKGLDIGGFTTAEDSITFERPEGTYVFERMDRDENGNLSGVVSLYDLVGQKINEAVISRVAVVDNNRIDYEIAGSTSEKPWSESGTLVGVKGVKGLGVAVTASHDGATRPVLVNYGTLAVSGEAPSPLPLLSAVAISSVNVGSVAEDDGGGPQDESCEELGGIALLGWVALCVVVIIIIIVVIECYVYCTPRACC